MVPNNILGPSEGRVMSMDVARFKAFIVSLILDGRPEDALERLAASYHVSVPRIKVGLPKGRKKNVLGCYTAKDKTISLLNSDALGDPYVVLHEFYHHLRTRPDRVHRGTERNATEFAKDFIQAYNALAATGSNV